MLNARASDLITEPYRASIPRPSTAPTPRLASTPHRQSILSQLLITRISFNPVFSSLLTLSFDRHFCFQQSHERLQFSQAWELNIPQRQEPSTNYTILAPTCKVQKAVLWKIPFNVNALNAKPLSESMEEANWQVLCLAGNKLFVKWQLLIENQLKAQTPLAGPCTIYHQQLYGKKMDIQ